MVNKQILVTGGNGYLASNLIRTLDKDNTIILYDGDVCVYKQYSDIDVILHFASPSDIYGFSDQKKTVTTIVDGTLNMLKIAINNSAKLIYASTMGIHSIDLSNDFYSSCKLAMEHYIKSVYNNYIILRIPRVYSKCRKKGLMRQIRENTIPDDDMSNSIEYITIEDFVDQTTPILDYANVVHEYKITQTRTISEIKNWIL